MAGLDDILHVLSLHFLRLQRLIAMTDALPTYTTAMKPCHLVDIAIQSADMQHVYFYYLFYIKYMYVYHANYFFFYLLSSYGKLI